nr:MAG: ORF1 [TTV-like mini virus]
MPWPYRRRRYWGRRYRRWRFGKPIRTRRRRRYFYRVRPRYKLQTINVREWQPPSIRNCYIKGLASIVHVNSKRLSYNSTLYEESTVPEHHPGGGGFGVMQFTLDNLFTMHEKCINWWTASNEMLPLCRYKGCKLKFYQSETIDYIIKIQNSQPFTSNKLSYPSCQPFMLMMSSHKYIIPSKQTRTLTKPYKTAYIKPPPNFQTKWYFQKDICKLPLLLIHAAPTTLLHTFYDKNSESNNISIMHLNTRLINNHSWGDKKWDTEHYPYKIHGTSSYYIYRYNGNENTLNNLLLKFVTPLTQAKIAQEGWDYEEAKQQGLVSSPSDYKRDLLKLSGNLFQKEIITHPENLWYSTVSPTSLFNDFQENKKVVDAISQPHERSFIRLTDPIVTYTRYNPNTDTGETTKMFLLKNNTYSPNPNWDPPDDEDLILGGFPLWLNIFGFLDFQIKLKKIIHIPENTILCFQNKTTKPMYTDTFVILDSNIFEHNSPYEQGINPADRLIWYPQIQFQNESINNITKCGPGITKLETHSEEIKIKYSFNFNWGGAPAKMITVDNPIEQPMYPIPRNFNESTSLQSPTQNFETVLYTFDQRNYQPTQQALKRMQQDWETKRTLSSLAATTTDVPVLQTLQALLQETETEEENEETLLQQLSQHKQQQLQLKHRIIDLLQKMS